MFAFGIGDEWQRHKGTTEPGGDEGSMGAVLTFALGGATTTHLELAATVMVPGELVRSRYCSTIASSNVVFLFSHHKPKII